jgi:hypothetical protein
MKIKMIKSTLKKLQKLLLTLFVITGVYVTLNNDALIKSIEKSQTMIFWILFFTFFILSVLFFIRGGFNTLPKSNAGYYSVLSKIIERFLAIIFSLIISIILSFLTRFLINFIVSFF